MPKPSQPSFWSVAAREMVRVMFVFLTHILVAALVIALAWSIHRYLPDLLETPDPHLLGLVPLHTMTTTAALAVAVAVILWAPFAALRAR